MDLGLDTDLIDGESAGDVMDGTDTLCKFETTGEVMAHRASIDSAGQNVLTKSKIRTRPRCVPQGHLGMHKCFSDPRIAKRTDWHRSAFEYDVVKPEKRLWK
jgi:hypothetical protein